MPGVLSTVALVCSANSTPPLWSPETGADRAGRQTEHVCLYDITQVVGLMLTMQKHDERMRIHYDIGHVLV